MPPLPSKRSMFIGTSNHGFSHLAQEEIRRLLPETSFVQLVSGETFLLETPCSRAEALSRLVKEEPIFLRHLQPVDARWERRGDESDLERLQAYVAGERTAVLPFLSPGTKTAIHFRKAEGLNLSYSAGDVKEALGRLLRENFGVEMVVQNPRRIVSVYVSPDTVYIGVSAPEENLSDWPGGAVRFRKEEGQISRAKFKLLEAEQKFAIDFRRFARALDIGAAPGGWTSLLLERGLEVTAVDPAPLHPSLMRHPKVRYVGKNAGTVSFAPGSFDLLVCDMNWNPYRTARLLLPLTDALTKGGTAIVTLKLLVKKPMKAIREIVDILEERLELKKAKQLFHNREEITLWLEKKEVK